MAYVVEARVFYNGNIIKKVRPAEDGEQNSRTETRTCEIWVDVFHKEEEATQFAREYKR